MGNDAGKGPSPAQLDDLKQNTTFSGKEIREWYKRFHEDCPTGQMNREDFKSMYEQIFPDGDSSLFAEHVFRAYDKDGNGIIDFQEFVCTVSVASRGSIDEKLRWAFNMYDLDGNGYVTKKEATEIFRAILRMRGSENVQECIGTMTAEQAAEQIFLHLDKNGDDKLSDIEFIIGAKNSPMVLGLLNTTQTTE